MTKPNLTRSASLHLRLSAFGALFVALAANFEPLLAFVFALVAAGVLSKL